jgi:hypothetical protein
VRYQSFLKIEKIEPLLLEEARADLARLRGAHVLFTPDLCLAEAREFAPADPQVLPLSFVPSEKTPTGARRGAVRRPGGRGRRLGAGDERRPAPGELLQGIARLLRIGWRMEGGLAAARGPVPA